jgi:hypothetical protein
MVSVPGPLSSAEHATIKSPLVVEETVADTTVWKLAETAPVELWAWVIVAHDSEDIKQDISMAIPLFNSSPG